MVRIGIRTRIEIRVGVRVWVGGRCTVCISMVRVRGRVRVKD